MNTNSNYMRKPSAEPPNPNKEYYYNNYQYGKGRGYSNRDKHNWNNFNNFYAGEKKKTMISSQSQCSPIVNLKIMEILKVIL